MVTTVLASGLRDKVWEEKTNIGILWFEGLAGS